MPTNIVAQPRDVVAARGSPSVSQRSSVAVDDRLRALLAHELARSTHISRRPHQRRGAQQRRAGRSARGALIAEPHRGHAAEREAGDVRALDAEVVEQVDHVAADVVDAVRAGRRRRARRGRGCRSGRAGSARRARSTCGSHIAQRRAERVGEDERRRVLGAGDGVVRDHRCSRRRSTRRGGGAGVAAASPRLARMRSASTSRPSSDVAQPARGGAGRGRAGRVSGRHSLCQAPAARSCSCTIAASSVGDERRAPAARSRARRSRRPGCACAASPSSRRRRASRTSATSVCASSVMSRAALPIAPAATPSAPASSPIAAAQRVPGEQRRVEAEVAASA